MKNVNMALCFLDEKDNIVAKKDLNISWNLKGPDNESKLENILVMDEVASMLTYELKLRLDSGAVRELLDEVQRKTK